MTFGNTCIFFVPGCKMGHLKGLETAVGEVQMLDNTTDASVRGLFSWEHGSLFLSIGGQILSLLGTKPNHVLTSMLNNKFGMEE